MMIRLIMPRVSVTIVITNMEELKNHGIVLMRNSMPAACAKIATSTCTTKKNGKKRSTRNKETNHPHIPKNYQSFY